MYMSGGTLIRMMVVTVYRLPRAGDELKLRLSISLYHSTLRLVAV